MDTRRFHSGSPFALAALFLLAGCASTGNERDVHAADASGHRHGAFDSGPVRRAVAVLVPMGASGVRGTLRFDAAGTGVRVHGRITGLTPGLHGFHVHEFGDLTDATAGESAGDHFAPGGAPHGRPTDAHRHAGDLGNVEAGADGVAKVDIFDRMLQLEGPNSILGRAIVVHANEDKFTQPSGDAGPRVAIGVIGIAGPGER
jgi:Cu-Zn family superoxide dismutase